MSWWPDPVPKVEKERKVISYKEIEKQRKDAEDAKAAALFVRDTVMKLDLNQSAYDLSAQLWYMGPDSLSKVVNDDSVPAKNRAKVLEIMLMRGASEYSMDELRDSDAFLAKYYDGEPQNEQTLQYQTGAAVAIMNGGPALFRELSRSGDQLPSGRVPATEFMNQALREGGVLATYDNRQQVEKWIQGMPPGVRGMAMYHLADAASTSGFDEGKRLTGVSAGVGPVEFGIQWENAKDSHWQKVGRDIETAVTKDLKLHPEQKAAFYEGFTHADSHMESPRDHYTPPKQ
jgi:hypothetical protein